LKKITDVTSRASLTGHKERAGESRIDVWGAIYHFLWGRKSNKRCLP